MKKKYMCANEYERMMMISGSLVLVCVIVCVIAMYYAWTRQLKKLAPDVVATLRRFESTVVGGPLARALAILPDSFPGWKVRVHDVTNGGHQLHAWLLDGPGPVDTVAIQHVNGTVDNVTLGPGEWVMSETSS